MSKIKKKVHHIHGWGNQEKKKNLFFQIMFKYSNISYLLKSDEQIPEMYHNHCPWSDQVHHYMCMFFRSLQFCSCITQQNKHIQSSRIQPGSYTCLPGTPYSTINCHHSSAQQEIGRILHSPVKNLNYVFTYDIGFCIFFA